MRDWKQIIGWALLLATSAIVGIAVPNLGFGETLNDFNNGSVQKITMLSDRHAFDRTHCDGSKPYNDRHCASFEMQSDRK